MVDVVFSVAFGAQLLNFTHHVRERISNNQYFITLTMMHAVYRDDELIECSCDEKHIYLGVNFENSTR